ncbi:Nodulation protein D 2 [Halioglobus japonicus]|nr:Nodulation protein D 2 [Halioglobus japonicus]
MIIRELSKIDLNLLISLQVLLEERSVSRAAERLFITQPAMSKTLSRLRALFADDLFTRSSHGMQPTPRALELSASLRAIIGDISHLISGPQFDPATTDGEIAIALSEHAGFALLPRLLTQLSELTPQLNIHIITRIDNQLEALARGDLDFAIQIRQSQYTADYTVENLGLSPLSIMVRDGHPLASREITWEQLRNFPMIKLYASPQERLEFQQAGGATLTTPDHPFATLEISHLLTALELLRQSDYFMPAPAYLLHQEGATAGITGLPLPREADLNIHYALVRHTRTSNSPLHNWLWELITCTIRELRPTPQRKLRQRVTAGSANTPS